MTAELIRGRNLSYAWLRAMDHLLEVGGTATNFCVAFSDYSEEQPIRKALDDFIAARRAGGRIKGEMYPVSTVANTIFPRALYRWGLPGTESRQRLYDLHARAMRVQRRMRHKDKDNYFNRLVSWPPSDGPLNQLEALVLKLTREIKTKNPKSSIYEVGIEHPEFDVVTSGGDVRVQSPEHDKSLMGFPCLSHLSFTLVGGELHLTAIYRNQYFVARAYGNYVGLARLVKFVADESGCTPGEILCVATHADAEIRLGKAKVGALVEAAHSEGAIS